MPLKNARAVRFRKGAAKASKLGWRLRTCVEKRPSVLCIAPKDGHGARIKQRGCLAERLKPATPAKRCVYPALESNQTRFTSHVGLLADTSANHPTRALREISHTKAWKRLKKRVN